MKIYISLCLLGILVCVNSESCHNVGDCQHTICDQSHGWWLHCDNNNCGCRHDTFTGVACPTGLSNECNAAHGDRCKNVGGEFHCLDNVCHCIRKNIDIGK